MGTSATVGEPAGIWFSSLSGGSGGNQAGTIAGLGSGGGGVGRALAGLAGRRTGEVGAGMMV